MKNKVIVIGINHFNTLGMIRALGINGVKPHVIIVNPNGVNNYCAKSKYVSGYDVVTSDDEAYSALINRFKEETVKPVLVPTSDGAIYMIDTHHDTLAEKYIIPHINNKQGEIAKLMNKANQALWAQDLGIPTAKTFLVNFDEMGLYKSEDYPMPCIVKPVLSHEGSKGDIKRCDSKEELLDYFEELKAKGYFRILLQEFLFKDYEMELFGCMMEHRKEIPYILTKHVREWKRVGGSVCCHEFVLDQELHCQAKDILWKIQEYGYVGNFDIEIINIGGKIYLNEINFRNSGDIYACFYNKLYYAYYSYLDMIGEAAFPMKLDYGNRYYAMCEDRDINYVRFGYMSFPEWFKYFLKTKDFAYFSWNDLPGSIAFYKKYNVFKYILKKIHFCK